MRYVILIIISSLVVSCTNQLTANSAAETNAMLAIALLNQGYFKEAKQKLLLAQYIDIKEPSVWYGAGLLNARMGDIKQAEVDFLHAIRLSPKKGSSRNNYGVFLYQIGDYQNAIKQFLMALLDPQYLDMGDTYENLALCALKISDIPLAKIYFQKALEHDPNLERAKYYLRQFESLSKG